MQVQEISNRIPYHHLADTMKDPSKSQYSIEKNTSSIDTVEQSNISKTMASMLTFDKGTASNTTIHVNNATFQKIASYSTYHPDTRWSELGVDENKRWVVINGQRFESEKSEEEKAMAKRMQMTLIDHIQEHEDLQKEASLKEKVTLNFLNDHEAARAHQHPKIKNLLQNEKVMDMLKNISKASKGQIEISF